jgi:hypothetical protein
MEHLGIGYVVMVQVIRIVMLMLWCQALVVQPTPKLIHTALQAMVLTHNAIQELLQTHHFRQQETTPLGPVPVLMEDQSQEPALLHKLQPQSLVSAVHQTQPISTQLLQLTSATPQALLPQSQVQVLGLGLVQDRMEDQTQVVQRIKTPMVYAVAQQIRPCLNQQQIFAQPPMAIQLFQVQDRGRGTATHSIMV